MRSGYDFTTLYYISVIKELSIEVKEIDKKLNLKFPLPTGTYFIPLHAFAINTLRSSVIDDFKGDIYNYVNSV